MEPFYRGVGNYSFKPFSRKEVQCKPFLKGSETMKFFTVWSLTWNLANSKGLNPEEKSFLWKMLHNILPTQERLFHLKMKNTPHPNCLLCDNSEPENLVHSLVTCPFNSDVSAWLLSVVHDHLPLV